MEKKKLEEEGNLKYTEKKNRKKRLSREFEKDIEE